MGKMHQSGMLKIVAALGLGFTYPAFGECTPIYSDYTLDRDVSGCFEIRQDNVIFNGNGHTIYGNISEQDEEVIRVRASNVTVTNLAVDCNSKSVGIDFNNAGNDATASEIRVSNCIVGIENAGTGLTVSGIVDGGNNMSDNYMDVQSDGPASSFLYTIHLDGANNNKIGYGVDTWNTYYYDYYSTFYSHKYGVSAHANPYLYLYGTWFFYNSIWDVSLTNVPSAYLDLVHLGSLGHTLKSTNSHVVRTNPR
jgi:hypothetical protein